MTEIKRALLFVIALTASGATLLEQHIDAVLRQSPAVARGAVGIHAVQLRSGKILYSNHADHLFTPASNTKLFSTALALNRLGRDYKLKTRVFASGPDVVLFGGGDPSMSDQQIPYDKDAKPGDAMAGIEALADQIVASGVRSIEGDVVGDDTAYPWDPYPAGWGVDDGVFEYGAPVSALQFNSSTFRLFIHAGTRPGDPVTIDLAPSIEYFHIANELVTAPGSGRVHVDRQPGSRELRLWGTVAPGARTIEEDLAVDDPALYAASALYDALLRRGVAIKGGPVARHRQPGDSVTQPAGKLIAQRDSPPLIELLRVTDKISQNLWAELMLRSVAYAKTGDGSRRAGLDELKAFLKEIGVPDNSYTFEDGSGLSRMGLVAPSTIVQLLRFMADTPAAAEWKTLLPVGAVDGTLQRRFDKNAAAHSISAKTGSLSHVNALSGYAESATYGEVVFSIIVNHTPGQASDVRSVIDKLALALVD